MLYGHPGIAHAAVVGLPDEYWSEAVTAFVVAAPGAELDPDEVVSFCKQQLTNYKVPKAIVVLDGCLRVWLNGQAYELEAGDAITFPCATPHRWLNPGESETRVIWIITPSTY